jgi:hypothetical protein
MSSGLTAINDRIREESAFIAPSKPKSPRSSSVSTPWWTAC